MERRRQEGFSLVELAVVLIIAGLILAIGAPSLRRYLESNKVADATRQVASDMRLARQRAVTNGNRIYFFIGSGASSSYYWTGVSVLTDPVANTWTSPVWTQWTLPTNTKQLSPNFGGYTYFFYGPEGAPHIPVSPYSASSGSVKVSSSFPTVHDTTTLNLDLTGNVWQ